MGKSLRPVLMTFTPAFFASYGRNTGSGLAMANITRLKAMVRTISAVNTPEIHLRLLSLPQEYLSSFKVGFSVFYSQQKEYPARRMPKVPELSRQRADFGHTAGSSEHGSSTNRFIVIDYRAKPSTSGQTNQGAMRQEEKRGDGAYETTESKRTDRQR